MKSLSGGERNRLLLARLFTQPANALILDEPTNDLDLDTLELLETLLQDYSGTVFLVSHDREFLNNVVTQIYAFEGEGRVVEYAGDYDDWERVKKAQAEDAQPARPVGQEARSAAPNKPRGRGKLSFKETNELSALPEKIATLEKEQRNINERLVDADLYRNQPDQVKALQARVETIDGELLDLLARWEALEAKQNPNGQT